VKEQTKAGSFSAFLEARLRRERGQQPGSPVAALDLLGILAAVDRQQLPVADLMGKSGMEFVEYAEALKSLRSAGLVATTGTPGTEIVQLTPKGAQIADLSAK